MRTHSKILNMKTYTITQLKKIAKDQGYQMAALENVNGERLVSFNVPKMKAINEQLTFIDTRLGSDIHPDGVYNVCMSHNISKSRNPDRYTITKGKVNATELSEASKQVESKGMFFEKTDLLSQSQAIAMLTEISELKARVKELEFINGKLLEEIDDLQESEPELSEGAAPTGISSLASLLKETIPQFMPLADRFFNIQEQQIALEHAKIQKGIYTGQRNKSASSGKRKEILPGSKEHMEVIEHWYNSEAPNAEEMLNRELDKLKAFNIELYAEVLQKLDMEEEEETNE